MLPEDYIEPVYRCTPAHASRVFTVGLDPREAAYVLERGWARIDGVRWRVSLEGLDGTVQSDGRVMVRIDLPQEELLYIPEERSCLA